MLRAIGCDVGEFGVVPKGNPSECGESIIGIGVSGFGSVEEWWRTKGSAPVSDLLGAFLHADPAPNSLLSLLSLIRDPAALWEKNSLCRAAWPFLMIVQRDGLTCPHMNSTLGLFRE
jgi:hypothetical protein